MDGDDPFEAVKLRVEDALAHAVDLFESWKRVYKTVSSPNSQELVHAANELKSSLPVINEDLEDLDEALRAAEDDPSSFRLNQAELSKRRKFLINSKETLKHIQYTMTNPPPKEQWSRNNSSLPSNYNYHSDEEAENSRQIEREGQQISIMMQEQDHYLENMSGTVGNLKNIAGTINMETEDQAVLIEELGDHVDRSESKLKGAMRRVTDILRKEEESKSGYCVCCLIIVLIILLVLVIVA